MVGQLIIEHRIQHFHLLRIRHGDPLMSILRAHSAEILLLVVKKFNRFDDDGIREQTAPECRLFKNRVEFGITLFECSR